MTTAWVALDSPSLPTILQRAFNLHLSPSSDRAYSLDDLSRVARHNGFTMNVRAAELPLEDRCEGPHLILRDGKLLTVMSRGTTWLVLDAEGTFLRLPASEVFDLLSTDDERAEIERYRRSMEHTGVNDVLAERLLRKLGIARGNELADWMVQHAGAVRNVDAFARLALDHPQLLPMTWHARSTPAQVKEISFDYHMQLRGRHVLRGAAADLVRSESSLLFSLLGIVLVGIPVGYLLPLCIAFLIDRARGVGDTPVAVLALLVSGLVLASMLGAVRSLGFVRLTARIRVRLLNAFLFRLLGCRIQSLRSITDGDLATRLSDLFVAQQLLFGQTLPSLLSSLMLVGGLIYLGMVAPVLLLPLGIAAVLIAVVYVSIAPRLRDLTRERLVTYSAWKERLIERFENWKLFKHFDPEHGMLSRIDPYLSATADLGQRGAALGALLTASTALVALGFLGAAWSLGVRGYQNETYSLGQFLVLMGLALGTFRGMVGLASLVSAWVRAEPSIRRLRDLVDHTEAEPQADLRTWPRPMVHARTGLAIRDLTFAWPEREPILSRLSLVVEPSEWIAIVGKSGSGKSTLAYILGGLIEPTDGSIDVGGQSSAALDELRRHVAVVPQEPILFDVTLKENITTGIDSIDDESLQRSVEISALTDLVKKRRRGLDDFVGENGSQVSVGEKVRIALARALVHEPRVLVLDETFGHLDEGTTTRIVENIRREKLAVILLTHDEKLARRCDRMYALNDGRLLER